MRSRRVLWRKLSVTLFCVLYAFVLHAPFASAEEHLDAVEIGAITVGSAGILLIGNTAASIDSTKISRWKTPLPGELAIEHLLGGRYYPGKTNFLSGSIGGLATPLVSLAGLVAVDAAWGVEDTDQMTVQDMFLFACGLGVNAGLTQLAKGILARPRPYVRLQDDTPGPVFSKGFRYDHQSFYSGHTSSAFFSVTYLNKRIRSIMRGRLTNGEYQDWSWLPPAILYSWATFVGWSRIHSYEHYLSDVAVGALAGFLIAELFYSFNDGHSGAIDNQGSSPLMFRVSFSF
jgi:membrane-associated phospholipid phosphatase